MKLLVLIDFIRPTIIAILYYEARNAAVDLKTSWVTNVICFYKKNNTSSKGKTPEFSKGGKHGLIMNKICIDILKCCS